MAETGVLALDVGSSSVRLFHVDDDARLLGDPARFPYRTSAEGTCDPQELLAAATAALGGESPEALGVASFWHSLLALDRRGRPLTPVLTWRDVRSAPHARGLAERIDAGAARRRTGAPLHASFWPAKLAWLAAAQPDVFAAAARFVSFADWLLLERTGELRTSVSLASGTGLWSDEGWDADLLAVLGIEPGQLPPVLDEPVDAWHPVLGDGAASNLGSGCTAAGRAALNLGTSAALRVAAGPEGDAPPPGLFRYRIDARRALVGGAVSAGAGLLAWLRDTVRLGDTTGLAARPAAAHGVSFVPHLAGERSPGWNDAATGAIAGLRHGTTPLDLAQAAVEGLALELRRVADLLPPLDQVVVSGGLAHDADVVQIVADVLERPLLVSAEPEASARGAAVAVLERLGRAPGPPAVSHAVEPRMDRAEAYRSALERHLRLMRGVT